MASPLSPTCVTVSAAAARAYGDARHVPPPRVSGPQAARTGALAVARTGHGEPERSSELPPPPPPVPAPLMSIDKMNTMYCDERSNERASQPRVDLVRRVCSRAQGRARGGGRGEAAAAHRPR